MEIIIHRVNSIAKLRQIPERYGVEVDVRSFGSKLILNHEPKFNGQLLKDYLHEYKHGTIIFNIKEAGIEKEIISLSEKYKIKKFFLLDVEHPFIITSKIRYKKYLSVRFSEFEPIQLANKFQRFTSWVWIDTVNKLPLSIKEIKIIRKFKSCLVSPERWNRKNDIRKYISFFKKNKFTPNAVMTEMNFSKIWEKF